MKAEYTGSQNIGIIGGGQLAKMTAISAVQLGCNISIMEHKPSGVGANLAINHHIGDWNNVDDLLSFAQQVDVLTLENEFVDANGLQQLEQAGYKVFPHSKTIRLIQDKLIQKQTLQQAGLPLAAYQAIESRQHIVEIAEQFNWPIVIKARRNGYDGKGNVTVHNADEIEQAWNQLNGDEHALYAEAFCPFIAELATIITVDQNGDMLNYPLVESIQHQHICHVIHAPAQVSHEIATKALDLARHAVTTFEAIGSIGVEMFLLENEEVLINELAPRVHNSGHYTIEACECSQFENHLRAIMGWPLGSPNMIKPAAVMVNLLGETHSNGQVSGLNQALAIKGAHTHIYGKHPTVPGRKMGHVTALGNNISEAKKLAQQTANFIKFGATR